MNRAYSNFINSIGSEETKQKYDYCLRQYQKFLGAKFNLYLEKNRKKVENKIIDYILHLRKLKLASNTINSRIVPIYHFYEMNDVLLNKTKINKYKGE
jgi:hypothetical protein